MKRIVCLIAISASLVTAQRAQAQPPADPSGHWEGTVDLQGNQLPFGVDFVRDTAGALTGTIDIPSQQLTDGRLRTNLVGSQVVSRRWNTLGVGSPRRLTVHLPRPDRPERMAPP